MSYRSSLATPFDAVGGVTTYVANLPAGVADGDRLIAHCTWDGGNTVTPPAGWTQIADIGEDYDSQTSLVYERVAASEPASYSWDNNGSPVGLITIYAFSGRGTGASIVSVTNNGSAGFTTPISITYPSLTALQGDDIIALVEMDANTSGDTYSFGSFSNGLTSRQQNSSFSGGAGGIWVNDCGATLDNVGAGVTGTMTSTATRSAGSGGAGWSAALISIPAAPIVRRGMTTLGVG